MNDIAMKPGDKIKHMYDWSQRGVIVEVDAAFKEATVMWDQHGRRTTEIIKLNLLVPLAFTY